MVSLILNLIIHLINMTYNQLVSAINAVKLEWRKNANTANRVGSTMQYIVDYFNAQNNASVSVNPQSLTAEQKAQARINIGVTETGGEVLGNEMAVSETAPANPVQGNKWFSLTTGEEYNRVNGIWITD